MRIITWNINSLRLRLPLLQRLAEEHDPDLICLQETKVPDPLYPRDAIAELGYPHQLYRGMKGYNGVTILSRTPLEPAADKADWCGKTDCRHIAATLQTASGPITVHNFYVPAGGDIPDPQENEKFAHKLAFLEETAAWFKAHPPRRSLLVGDLNIAPLEHDVWSHRQLLRIVSHTPPETSGLLQWMRNGFEDAMRAAIPEPEKLFTWWSYRNRDWKKSNRGRRLDHIWATPDIMPGLKRIEVLSPVRDWDSPSDHAPVLMDMDL